MSRGRVGRSSVGLRANNLNQPQDKQKSFGNSNSLPLSHFWLRNQSIQPIFPYVYSLARVLDRSIQWDDMRLGVLPEYVLRYHEGSISGLQTVHTVHKKPVISSISDKGAEYEASQSSRQQQSQVCTRKGVAPLALVRISSISCGYSQAEPSTMKRSSIPTGTENTRQHLRIKISTCRVQDIHSPPKDPTKIIGKEVGGVAIISIPPGRYESFEPFGPTGRGASGGLRIGPAIPRKKD